MILTMFATSIKFVNLANMIFLRFLRFLYFIRISGGENSPTGRYSSHLQVEVSSGWYCWLVLTFRVSQDLTLLVRPSVRHRCKSRTALRILFIFCMKVPHYITRTLTGPNKPRKCLFSRFGPFGPKSTKNGALDWMGCWMVFLGDHFYATILYNLDDPAQ